MKRSNSKSSQHRSPQLRPQYVNAAIRAAPPSQRSLSLSVAHTSYIPITEAHTRVLTEIAQTGKVPPSLTWAAVRDSVFKPYLERLLAISLECRSDVCLPNGRWIGAGLAPPTSSERGAHSGEGLIGAGSMAAEEGGRDGEDESEEGTATGTSKTAPNTPLGDDASSKKKNNNNSSDSNDDESDSDNAKGHVTSSPTAAASAAASSAMAPDVIPAVLDKADLEAENEYILDQWGSLSGPTFTLQRLAEVVLSHRRYNCHDPSQPYGTAAISLSGATLEGVGTGPLSIAAIAASAAGGANGSGETTPLSKRPHKAETSSSKDNNNNNESAGGGDVAQQQPLRSPRSRGVLRGEKLQAAIRRCVLVAPLVGI